MSQRTCGFSWRRPETSWPHLVPFVELNICISKSLLDFRQFSLGFPDLGVLGGSFRLLIQDDFSISY